MNTTKILAALFATVLLMACRENETTIFIEHVKVQPKAPECAVEVGDPESTYATFDLAFGTFFPAAFAVKNRLVSRENYDNLVAESNGVFIEGAEVYVQDATGAPLGSPEFIVQEIYLEPETEQVVIVTVVSQAVTQALMERYDCLPLSSNNYPLVEANDGTDPTASVSGVDINGNLVARSLGAVYGVAKLLGHTNGGVEVETQDYTFRIDLCCGCLVEWMNCGDICSLLCTDRDASEFCVGGVANGGSGLDCRSLYPRRSEKECADSLPCSKKAS